MLSGTEETRDKNGIDRSNYQQIGVSADRGSPICIMTINNKKALTFPPICVIVD